MRTSNCTKKTLAQATREELLLIFNRRREVCSD